MGNMSISYSCCSEKQAIEHWICKWCRFLKISSPFLDDCTWITNCNNLLSVIRLPGYIENRVKKHRDFFEIPTLLFCDRGKTKQSIAEKFKLYMLFWTFPLWIESGNFKNISVVFYPILIHTLTITAWHLNFRILHVLFSKLKFFSLFSMDTLGPGIIILRNH